VRSVAPPVTEIKLLTTPKLKLTQHIGAVSMCVYKQYMKHFCHDKDYRATERRSKDTILSR